MIREMQFTHVILETESAHVVNINHNQFMTLAYGLLCVVFTRTKNLFNPKFLVKAP